MERGSHARGVYPTQNSKGEIIGKSRYTNNRKRVRNLEDMNSKNLAHMC